MQQFCREHLRVDRVRYLPAEPVVTAGIQHLTRSDRGSADKSAVPVFNQNVELRELPVFFPQLLHLTHPHGIIDIEFHQGNVVLRQIPLFCQLCASARIVQNHAEYGGGDDPQQEEREQYFSLNIKDRSAAHRRPPPSRSNGT